ncbi:hypothetical protein GCM10023339_29820 [Alloalcanivorax gelatiniphagus]
MSRTTRVIVALATLTAVLTGWPAGAGPEPSASSSAQPPSRIPGGVELVLADGDLFRVWASGDGRGAVWSRRRDADTGVWGERVVVLQQKNLVCRSIDARTAHGAVAAVASCDRYNRSDDQGSRSSRALWSVDTVTWSSYDLDTDAFAEPGISPDGQSAVWPLIGRYVTRTTAGFTERTLAGEGLSVDVAATITDIEQVSFLYRDDPDDPDDGRCPLVVLTRTGDATPARQEIAGAMACTEHDLTSVDADTVLLGAVTSPAERTVVSRPDAASPWAITEVAPAGAPGLEGVDKGLEPGFFTAPGLPLFALGSRNRHVVRAQVYDPTTQTWDPSTVAYDAGRRRCRWAEARYAEPLAVVLAELVCGGRRVVLTTGGDGSWKALRGGTQPVAPSPDGRHVAVPARGRTFVVSPEMGVVSLSGRVTGPCDVVVPDGPRGAVLLTADRRHRGWPTVLKHSTRRVWVRLSRTEVTIPPSTCRRAEASTDGLPYAFRLQGNHLDAFTARIVQRDSRWKAVLRRW